MGKIEKIKDIYQSFFPELNKRAVWANMLNGIARYWKLGFTEALLIYAQNPAITTPATFDVWEKAHRKIMRGQKSVAVINTLEDTALTYYFDISQTYGKPVREKWRLSETAANELALDNGFDNIFEYLKEKLAISAEKVYHNIDSQYLTALDKDFVKRLGIESAIILCAARCGITISEQPLAGLETLEPPAAIAEMGIFAHETAKDVLYEIERYIRRNEHGRHGLQGNQRGSVPGHRIAEAPVNNGEQSKEDVGGGMQNSGDDGRDERFEREDLRGDSRPGEHTQDGRNNAAEGKSFSEPKLYGQGSGNDGNPDSGRADGEYADVQFGSRGLSGGYDGKEPSGAGAIPTQINPTKSLVDSSFEQLSFFSFEEETNESEEESFITDEIMLGSGFSEGKFRIQEFFMNNNSNADRAAFLKKEYGTGGRYGGGISQNHDTKGLTLDHDGKNIHVKLSWRQVANRIAQLAEAGKYITDEDIEHRIEHARWTVENKNDADLFNEKTVADSEKVLEQYHVESAQPSPENTSPNPPVDSDLTIKSPISEQPTEAQPSPAFTSPEKPKAVDFSGEIIYAAGPKAKCRDNLTAIKLLLEIERERRNATPSEQELLVKYSGWGGIPQAFDSEDSAWQTEYAELKSLLSPADYDKARESTLTAFYTEPYIIREIYRSLENMGFNGGEILEEAVA